VSSFRGRLSLSQGAFAEAKHLRASMRMSERPLQPDPAPDRLHYAWVILAVGALVVFGALGLARFGYTMLLPPMQGDLGLDNTQAGALATANLAGYLALTVIGGALASHFGPRIVITWGWQWRPWACCSPGSPKVLERR